MKLEYLKNLGTGCPTQWEGKTEDGKHVFVRYRWGLLRVDVGDERGVLGAAIGEPFSGIMGDADLQEFLTANGWEVKEWQHDMEA